MLTDSEVRAPVCEIHGSDGRAFERVVDALHGPLQARHYMAMCRGETGDTVAAAAAFTELVADRIRVLGPNYPDTVRSRHELARWQDQTDPESASAQ